MSDAALKFEDEREMAPYEISKKLMVSFAPQNIREEPAKNA